MITFKTYLEEKDPCWNGYKQLGMKKKKGKEVPNCVPEAVEVRHDRYLRSHGKKAKGSGSWMFGHKSMGDIDHKDMHHASGTFAKASASAKKWAKEKGHRAVYVMEQSEVLEGKGMDGMTQKGGHKRPTEKGAGLTQKGVEKYRRQNPGSKLQTAVTTPPSKLDPDSKAAKRRKSFCARSRGWTGERGKAARRRWNC